MYSTSFPIGLQGNWIRASDIVLPNEPITHWLLDAASLTEKLQVLTSCFELGFIGQGVETLDKVETDLLSLKPTKFDINQWQVREVVLMGDDKPWVFARSVIPQSLCEGRLATLGKQPLGKIIFNDDYFTRSHFYFAQLNYNPVSHTPTATKQSIWGRRSVFTGQGETLLVGEVFLPECPAYLSQARRP